MKLDIEVKNLGKLKKGTVKVRPLTVLTGENGTGKSFFTKVLYSAFNTLNTNVLHRDITLDMSLIDSKLTVLKLSIQRISQNDRRQINNLSKSLSILQDDLNKFKDESATVYFLNTIALYEQTDKFLAEFESYLKEIEKKPIKIKLAKKTTLEN